MSAALVFLVVPLLVGACDGSSQKGAEQLVRAIATYTDTGSTYADDLARRFGGSDDSLRSLATTIDNQSPLPAAAPIGDDLANLGRTEGFDGARALTEFCTAVVNAVSPSVEVGTDDSGALIITFAEADPASKLGPELMAAATRVLVSGFGVGGYTQELLDLLVDRYWDHATEGTPRTTSPDPADLLLWLRLQQIRAAVC